MRRKSVAAITATLLVFGTVSALAAQGTERLPSATLAKLKELMIDRDVDMTTDKVDHERLTVRRLDVVDDKGVIRMIIAGRSPGGILDGIEYKRAFPTSGITIFDENGSERGGFGMADIPGGAPILAVDHRHHDAIGWRVMPDGSIMFGMTQREPEIREPGLGNKVMPALRYQQRLRMSVAADGTPSIELADREGRARIRLATRPDGGGEIQFLSANGRVTQSLSGEGLQAVSKQ